MKHLTAIYMKTCITLLMIMICLVSFGQYQTPFPDSLASWRFQSWQYADPGDPGSQTTYSAVTVHARDTVHKNGFVYTQLYADSDGFIYNPENCLYNGELVGYHRIEGDQVYYIKEPTAGWVQWAYFEGAGYEPYFYSNYHFNTENEILLYDFGLTVGDSFNITQYDTVIVETIDSVLIENHYYKRFNFDVSLCMLSNIPSDYHWIEGIGSSFGYFPYANCFESGGKGLCFHEYFHTGTYSFADSISSYEFENGYCWILQLGENELSVQNSFTVSPNPVSETLHLEFTDENNFIEITNSSGVLFDRFNAKGSTLMYDMSRFSSGVYFIKVDHHVQRIVKN